MPLLSILGKGTLALAAVGALGAYEMMQPNVREQAFFLERFADRIACAQQIAPETHRAVSQMLDRIGHQPTTSRDSADMEVRRRVAIVRIETLLRDENPEAVNRHAWRDCRPPARLNRTSGLRIIADSHERQVQP